MKKKVLVWETLATVSGGQKMTLAVMDLLRDKYDFVCLIPEEGRMSEELDLRGIPYMIIGDQSMPRGVKGKSVIFRYGIMTLRCIWKSLTAIRKYKPDMLYAPGPAALPWSAICGTLTGKPVIWHLHHIFLDGMTGKLLNICSKWKSVRKIIAVSECVGCQIKSPGGTPKVSVAYNPIDVEKYSSGSPERVVSEIEDTLGIKLQKGKNAVLTHVALVQRSKKQDVVLRTIGVLQKRGVSVIGLFPGEVREPDYMDELANLATDLGIDDRVIFWGRRDDIPDILSLSDVVMIPSVFEGFSLAAQEAAAAGVPTVAVNIGGVAEFVRLTGAGMTFEEDNADEAANNIISVISDKETFGQRGVDYSANWSTEKYCNGILAQFSEVEKYIK